MFISSAHSAYSPPAAPVRSMHSPPCKQSSLQLHLYPLVLTHPASYTAGYTIKCTTNVLHHLRQDPAVRRGSIERALATQAVWQTIATQAVQQTRHGNNHETCLPRKTPPNAHSQRGPPETPPNQNGAAAQHPCDATASACSQMHLHVLTCPQL
jgi:hypothetical protein